MKKDQLLKPGQYIARPRWLSYIPPCVLNENGKVTFSALLNRLRDNETTWPEYPTLCFDTGLSRSSLDASLNQLRCLKLIDWETASRGSNEYTLSAPPALFALDDEIRAIEESHWERKAKVDYSKLQPRIDEVVGEWLKSILTPEAFSKVHSQRQSPKNRRTESRTAVSGSKFEPCQRMSQTGFRTTPVRNPVRLVRRNPVLEIQNLKTSMKDK